MSSQLESLQNSYLFGGNAPYVEELYELYLNNPGSVPDSWRAYFDQLQHFPATDGQTSTRDQTHAPVVESFAQQALQNKFSRPAPAAGLKSDLESAARQVHVQSLIAAYRTLGSRWADLDPLKHIDRPDIPELEPSFYGLIESDLDQVVAATNTYFTTDSTMTVRQILKALRDTYCRSVGTEFMHISDPVVKRWVQQRLESTLSAPTLT
ncbi:MAG: 2-oxoglutarate dehydrogenase E1 component, partial [Burkholderiaceae bacterium]|nr:2-oxoglutarate dehydrogenase E1 component [Burkholderiaceae bacterium]